MRSFIGLVIGVTFGVLATGAGFGIYMRIHPAEPPPQPISSPPPPDVLARFTDAIAAGDRICGPVPWEIEVAKDSIKFTCGRPTPIVKVKVAAPRIAEATP